LNLTTEKILNCSCINTFPADLAIIKSTRFGFNNTPNAREYTQENGEGLFSGYDNVSYSTALQALHLACIMGCDKIYFIGCEFMFTTAFDHFYEDRLYRDSLRGVTVAKVVVDGTTYESTGFLVESAKHIDRFITESCIPVGIMVYDFSNGLLQTPVKLDFNAFIKETP
jgi:hypothetical protein